ncbi:helix-hairpin-helix domain-containing protein [Streptacidiphilus fuscans]|uniref:ATP-binding domain-containing protein n=1 Tax=Streptacidiphilus fuscans TaxID=2789292 RepID=A0A931FF88_9ACTN|nr:helix-hairpin-helix domain-containing protein [Streptacidiphilus fuscans]MBF9070025.1 ATP-binding domain-containing protein [Streptacidiphilus fuscans]
MSDTAANTATAVTAQLAEAIRAADGQAQDVDAQARDAVADAAAILGEGGAPAQLAPAVVGALGERAADALREDPWAVLSVPGVLPANADEFARGLLGAEASPGDERRANALVQWLLERASLHGHTAVELGEIHRGLADHGVPAPDEALAQVLTDGRVMAFQEEGDDEDESEEAAAGQVLLALDRLALAEESLADGLVRLSSTFPGRDAAPGGSAAVTDDTEEPSEEQPSEEEPSEEQPAAPRPSWDEVIDAAPNSSAAALIRAVADSALVLHTGGETARSEPVALLQAARQLGLRAALTATHADSARRLDPDAVPLATLLASGERDEDGTLALDLLIVCDAPALDAELAATVAESLADGGRLVLSGDPGDLWSAGPGRVFADLVAAKPAPVVASRQPDFGPIGELVSGIGIGELEPVEAPEKEVVLVQARDAAEAVHRAVQLVGDSIPRALGIPSEQVRVLVPAHAGPAGTRALNAALKQRLNPGPGQFGGFDAGDAVVRVPAPGVLHEGVVRGAVPEGLEIAFGSETVVVPREQLGEVRHGWALTAHQAAGRRWPGVVVVVPPEAGPELSRQWLYSACGRAERHLSLINALGPALPQTVATHAARPRTTRLRTILSGE